MRLSVPYGIRVDFCKRMCSIRRPSLSMMNVRFKKAGRQAGCALR